MKKITVMKTIFLYRFLYITVVLSMLFQPTYAQWTGLGTAQDPYQIYTVADLESIRTNEIAYNNYDNIHFELMNDINDSLTTYFATDFYGYFHGKGHYITLDFNNAYYTDNTLIQILSGAVDSLVLIGDVSNFYALFIQINGKISNVTCNLNINVFSANNSYGAYIFCSFNYGTIEYCINNSNLTVTANLIVPNIMIGCFAEYNYNEINHCINNGNIEVNVGNFSNVYIACFTEFSFSNSNILNCINNGNIIMNGIPATATLQCFTNINIGRILNCMNTGNISVRKIDNVGIFTNENHSIVSNCINTGTVYVAGENITVGIVGKMYESPQYIDSVFIYPSIIENCVNAGKITGIGNSMNIGGIAAKFETTLNASTTYIRNNVVLAKTNQYSIFGEDITNYPNWVIENNFYDKQMLTIPATPTGDVAGKAEGLLTTELTGFALQSILGSGWSYADDRYPIPLGLENYNAALIAATPIYLQYTDQQNYNSVDSVSENFTVGLLNNPLWQVADNKVTITGQYATLQNTGSEILTPTLNGYSKNIEINIRSIPTQNYTVSGTVKCNGTPLPGVTLNCPTCETANEITNQNGYYEFTVEEGANVKITPTLSGYTFVPSDTTINNITGDVSNVNFKATAVITTNYTVSGKITINDNALEGVMLSCPECLTQTTTTNTNGEYSFNVSKGTNITITPNLVNYNFTPEDTTINNITQNIINVDFVANTVGIDDYELTNSGITVYPNPTNGQIMVKTLCTTSPQNDASIQIYDISGRVVHVAFPSFGGVPERRGGSNSEFLIDLSHLESGIYYLRIGNETTKVMKN